MQENSISEIEAKKQYDNWLRKIRDEDIEKVKEILKELDKKDFENDHDKMSHYILIATKIRDVSYKKWSVKDRYKDVPW